MHAGKCCTLCLRTSKTLQGHTRNHSHISNTLFSKEIQPEKKRASLVDEILKKILFTVIYVLNQFTGSLRQKCTPHLT